MTDCRISSIEIAQGADTLFYHYNADGTIDYISEGSIKIDFDCSNGHIIRREMVYNDHTISIDTIRYDSSGNITTFLNHDFFYGTSERTDFGYSNGKLSSAAQYLSDSTGTHTTSTQFFWSVNDDLVKFISMSNAVLLDSTTLDYSTAINPFTSLGKESPLIDPHLPFTGFNFHFLAMFYSRHSAVSGTKFYSGFYWPLRFFIIPTAEGRIQMYSVTPRDEGAIFNYSCDE